VIVFDTPRPVRFRHYKRTAHCASDLPGEAGTRELLAFGKRIGLREGWLQHRGQPREHFDLFDGRIEAARKAGAVEIDRREMITRVVRPKREVTP
jgi:hypothetical protein